jgi:hypothetical protein
MIAQARPRSRTRDVQAVADMGGVSADGRVLWLSGRYSIGHTGILR